MLRLDALTKRYPSFTLGPLSLDVGTEVVAVLGPSGSGKTTLLSLVAGTDVPSSGTVSMNGTSLSGQPLETRGAARVFQESALFPHLTARENIEYAASGREQTEMLAARLEIDSILDQTARTLSGGEGRRVEVARALAADPALLLLDEPTAGLDTPVRRRLRDHLRELLTALDIPVLYVTHNQEEAARVADRIAVMKDGIIQQVGPPDDVFQRPETAFVARFTGNPNVLPVRVEADDPNTLVLAGDARITYSVDALSAGQHGWVCVRPEEIEVRADAGSDSALVLETTIADCVFEGEAYELTLHIGTGGASLQARVLPPTYRALNLANRRRIAVQLPPDALHVIPSDE